MAAEFSLQMNEHVVDEVDSRLAAETAMAVVAACIMGSDLSQANGAGAWRARRLQVKSCRHACF